MADYTVKQAVRAFGRIWAPIDRAMYEAEMVDRHFDGGEWSGPAHGRIQQDRHDVVMEYVAGRFGMNPVDITNEMHRQSFEHGPWNW